MAELAYRTWRPEGATTCVVLGHGFSATMAAGLDRYGERFAGAGLAALAFDYRSFGESPGEPRDVLVVERQLEDWTTAIAHARALGYERIALWGTSYGGGHVLTVAARRHDLAAVVAQVPHVSGPATLRRLRPHVALAAQALGQLDRLGARLGLPPLYLPVKGLEPLYPPGQAQPHRVAARAYAELRTYVPARAAHRITCPALVQIAADDEITPAHAARAAAAAARAEVITYPGTHFDAYFNPQVLEDAVAFLSSLRPA